MSRFKPYPIYKDSGVEWLGVVPDHWTQGRLKNVATIRGGRDYKDVETEDEGAIPVIGSGGPFTYATEYLFDGESVLLGRKGTIDKPLYIKGMFWTVDTMFYTEIDSQAIPKFVYYLATVIPFSYYSTSTALPSMSQFDLSNHQVVFPGSSEQTQIARFLDHETAKIDTLIEEQQRLIQLLKEKRQAVISQAVTKGLDPNVPMKDSGVAWLGDVPTHWSITKLGHYAQVQTGFPFPSTLFSLDDSDIRLLRGANVGVGALKWEDTVYWSVDAVDQVSEYLVNEGQIVLGMDRPWIRDGLRIARVSPDDLPCLLLQRVAAITARRSLNDEYLFQLLSSEVFRAYVEPDLTGVSVPHISPEQILGFSIPLPPIQEQNQIVEFLKGEFRVMEALLGRAGLSVALLKERRSALVSAAVTGKIDVRGWRPPAIPQTENQTEAALG